MKKNSEFFTVKEMAGRLEVHINTVYRAIKYGRIHAFRVGSGQKGSLRIYKSEVERMAAFDLTNLIEGKRK
jgi:excisionase family DNA binding protein